MREKQPSRILECTLAKYYADDAQYYLSVTNQKGVMIRICKSTETHTILEYSIKDAIDKLMDWGDTLAAHSLIFELYQLQWDDLYLMESALTDAYKLFDKQRKDKISKAVSS